MQVIGLTNPQATIYDNAGVILIDMRGNSVPVASLTNGTYLVKIAGDGKTYIKKLLISH